MNACNWAYAATCGSDPACPTPSPIKPPSPPTRRPDSTKSPTPYPMIQMPPPLSTGGSDAAASDGIPPPQASLDNEIVSISMEVTGLGDDHDMAELKTQMITITKRILLGASDMISGLNIRKVDPIIMRNRNLRKWRRSLQKGMTQYFNVHVAQDYDKMFGPIIIEYFRNAKDGIIADIESHNDTTFFGPGEDAIGVNFCTTQNGKFDLCMIDKPRPPAPVGVKSNPDGEGGLPGWAIALIVLPTLALLCCIGYAVYINFIKQHDSCHIETRLVIYDGRNQVPGNDDDKTLSVADDRHRASNFGRTKVMDDRSKTSSQAGSRAKDGRSKTSSQVGSRAKDDRSQASGASRRSNRSQRKRDPSADHSSAPGMKQRVGIDPPINSSDQLALVTTDGDRSSRYSDKDPSIKPKRDPNMYAKGNFAAEDASAYQEDMHQAGQCGAEDPPLQPKRNPSVLNMDVRTVEGIIGESVGMEDIDEDAEYDSIEHKQEKSHAGVECFADTAEGSVGAEHSPRKVYESFSAGKISSIKTEEPHAGVKSVVDTVDGYVGAEYSPPKAHAPTYYAKETRSIKTNDPSVSSKSSSSRKSMKMSGLKSLGESSWGVNYPQDGSM